MTGLEVGSKTVEFQPNRGPGELFERNIKIRAESPAASSLLIFQAVFPFLLFAGNGSSEPIELEISGGTNVSFSLSYEYLDQVVLPTMESWFGIRSERRLQERGWSSGSASRGCMWFKLYPVGAGQRLQFQEEVDLGSRPSDFEVSTIDVSIIAPCGMHQDLQESLRREVQRVFPQAGFNVLLVDDSKHEARMYVLLVARSKRLRWGRDKLYQGKRKGKTSKQLSDEISRSVAEELDGEVRGGGVVDEFLQDQLVIFQALAEGRTSFPRGRVVEVEVEEGSPRKDRVKDPLGDPETDSNHTRTARWVTSELLAPRVAWLCKGKACEGVGLISGRCGT